MARICGTESPMRFSTLIPKRRMPSSASGFSIERISRRISSITLPETQPAIHCDKLPGDELRAVQEEADRFRHFIACTGAAGGRGGDEPLHARIDFVERNYTWRNRIHSDFRGPCFRQT